MIVKLRFWGIDGFTSLKVEVQLAGSICTLADFFKQVLEGGIGSGKDLEVIAKGMCGSGQLPRYYTILAQGLPVGLAESQTVLADNDEVWIIPLINGG